MPRSCADCLNTLGASTSWSPRELSRTVQAHLSHGADCTFLGSSPSGVAFSLPFRQDQPTFSTMRTGSFLGVKRPEFGADHERVTAILLPPFYTSEVLLWDGFPLLTFGKFWSNHSVPTAAVTNLSAVPL